MCAAQRNQRSYRINDFDQNPISKSPSLGFAPTAHARRNICQHILVILVSKQFATFLHISYFMNLFDSFPGAYSSLLLGQYCITALGTRKPTLQGDPSQASFRKVMTLQTRQQNWVVLLFSAIFKHCIEGYFPKLPARWVANWGQAREVTSEQNRTQSRLPEYVPGK